MSAGDGGLTRRGLVGCSNSRLLRLTLLAPDIIETILNGQQTEGMTLPGQMEPFPVGWERQPGATSPGPVGRGSNG